MRLAARFGALVWMLALGPTGCGPRKSVSGPAVAPSQRPQLRAEAAPPPPPRAQLIFVGGKIRTLDPTRPVATAVAVMGGKIVAVGSDADMDEWVGTGTKIVGIEGRTVVPGLVDSHLHLAELGMKHLGIDLTGTQSIEEVKSRVARAVRDAKPGVWLEGRGWDQNDWESATKKGAERYPTAKDLDGVAPENPVLLIRVDGHAAWVNTKALEAAGIGPKTVSPPGGQIVSEKGRPSGIFINNAMALVEGRLPPPSPGQLRRAFLNAQTECLAAGLTQVHDMGIGPTERQILRELDASGELKLRVYAALAGGVEDLGALMGDGPIIPGDPARVQGARRLTVRGIKFYVDGALGSRGALLFEPYADDPKHRGLLTTDLGLYEARVRTAEKHGFQVATHAIGDRGNRIVLDVYDEVFGRKLKESRPRIEHAQVLSPEDLPRFGARGVVASMQPTHATSDMPWAQRRIGPERIRGAYAWRSIMTSGATIAAGSDAPVEEVSPLLGLYAAITRKDVFGSPPTGWRPEERMSPEHALRAFTTAGAYASFREGEAGVIKPGFVADLTVLDVDPIGDPPAKLLKGKVEITVIEGEMVFSRPGADHPPLPPPPPDAGFAPPPDAGPAEPPDTGVPPPPPPSPLRDGGAPPEGADGGDAGNGGSPLAPGSDAGTRTSTVVKTKRTSRGPD